MMLRFPVTFFGFNKLILIFCFILWHEVLYNVCRLFSILNITDHIYFLSENGKRFVNHIKIV